MDQIRSGWGEVDKPTTPPGNAGKPEDVPQLMSGTFDTDSGDDIFEVNASWKTFPLTSTHVDTLTVLLPSRTSGSTNYFFGSSLPGSVSILPATQDLNLIENISKNDDGSAQSARHVSSERSSTDSSSSEDDFDATGSWTTVPVTHNYKSTHGDQTARFPSSSSEFTSSSDSSGSDPSSPAAYTNAAAPPTLHEVHTNTNGTPQALEIITNSVGPSVQRWNLDPFPSPDPEDFFNPAMFLPPLTSAAETPTCRISEDEDIYETLSHLRLGQRDTRFSGWSDSDQDDDEEQIPEVLITPPTLPSGYPQYEPLKFPERPEPSKDEAFLLDQVTPTSYLSSGRCISLRPTNFRVDLPNTHQMAHTDVRFFLVAKDSVPLFEPSYFSVTITGPSGFVPKALVYADRNFTDRYICTFHAVESGSYEIRACLGLRGKHHVDGSPCHVIISRNYAATPRRAILSRILSPAPYDGDAPGLRISESSKIWGITDNPVTEEIFAADRDAHAILRFSTETGELLLKNKFGACAPLNGKAFKPTGIDFDTTNQLLVVTDKDNHRVCIFQPNGTLVRTFGTSGHRNGQMSYPWGVAVSPNGELIVVADARNHRLQLFTKNGEFLRKYTVFETSPFEYKHIQTGLDYPRGICFDKSGKTIYVSDFNLRNVFAVNLEFTAKQPLCPMMRLVRPQGLAVDGAGNVLICDSRSGVGAVRVVRPDGVLIGNLEGPTNARTEVPIDLTVCRGGFICVVDMSGTRIRIF